MKYIKADKSFTEQIFDLVQITIKEIYPKFYPKEIVDFFCKLHSKENILSDIQNQSIYILFDNDILVGTGSFKKNHITRVYIKPEFQGKGYGNFIMNKLEKEISNNYDTVCLDSSLPASRFYEKRGYKTLNHERWSNEHGVTLVYEIMQKNIANTKICYDNRCFISENNTKNGEVDENTLFLYHQKGNILYAEYFGGEIIRGSITGTVADNGELDFYYQHINKQNEIKIGKCHSVPEIMNNGKIKLFENWEWLNGDKTKGKSVIIEKSI